MESAPYGPPRVDPSLSRHIPLFSASVILWGTTPEKGSGIGTPQRDTREGTVEINMSSLPAAATFDARASSAARVDEEALGSAARLDGSSGGAEDPWVRDPRSGIWNMGGRSVGEAKLRAREDMEIKGVYSHFPGNESSGGIRLGGVIASDFGDAVRLEDLRGLKSPYYDAHPAILDWEDFAEEVGGDMRQDMRDKWACCTFPHRWPRNSRRMYVIKFWRRGSIRRNSVWIGWSKKKELMLQTKSWIILGQCPSTWSVENRI